MTILLIKFTDGDIDPKVIEAALTIKDNCLVYHETDNEKTRKVVIPLYSIF